MFKKSLDGVAQAFLMGRRAGTASGTFCTNGREVWSYGVTIARWEGSEVLLSEKRWSKTTSRHQSLIKSVVGAHGVSIRTTEKELLC